MNVQYKICAYVKVRISEKAYKMLCKSGFLKEGEWYMYTPINLVRNALLHVPHIQNNVTLELKQLYNYLCSGHNIMLESVKFIITTGGE